MFYKKTCHRLAKLIIPQTLRYITVLLHTEIFLYDIIHITTSDKNKKHQLLISKKTPE